MNIKAMKRAEVAKMLGVGERTITDWCALKNDSFPRNRRGPHDVVYNGADVRAWWTRRMLRERGLNKDNYRIENTPAGIHFFLTTFYPELMSTMPRKWDLQ